MMTLMANWWTVLLVFVRISTFMITAPVFSGRQIPAQYKIGFSMVLSVLAAQAVKEPVGTPEDWTFMMLILKEFIVGILLGLVTQMLLYAVQLAGSMIDLQIGFSMASLYDPTFGGNVQLTGRFKNMLALLVLLTTNGHHLLIQGVLSSFDWISLKAALPALTNGHVSTFLLQCFAQMFMIGFMMAAPIIGTLFLVDMALGIVARTVPQMNIFAIFPPVKILIYFLIYILILPSFFYLLDKLFDNMFGSMYGILKLMGG